jgi:hypothetical protein
LQALPVEVKTQWHSVSQEIEETQCRWHTLCYLLAWNLFFPAALAKTAATINADQRKDIHLQMFPEYGVAWIQNCFSDTTDTNRSTGRLVEILAHDQFM